MLEIPAGLPALFTREQARAAGLTDRQLDRRLASGRLISARHGILRLADDPASPASPAMDRTDPPKPGPDGDRSALNLPVALRAALIATASRDVVVSHAAAACVHGLPNPLNGWPEPQFTATSGPTRRRRGLHILVAPLADSEIVQQDGVAVTSPTRTVADCLRTMPGRDALAIADAAVHRSVTSVDELVTTLDRQSGWPGVVNARRYLALVDGRRESPLESWSAWAFAHTEVPAPQWQVDVRRADGTFIGRGDCWWPGVIGEADGRSKYALAAAEQGGDADAVFEVLQAERQREQRLRDVGADVIRWSAGEVLKERAAQALSRRITAALAAALAAPRFEGVVAQAMLPTATSSPLIRG